MKALPLLLGFGLLFVVCERVRRNPSAEQESMVFHGEPDEVKRLSPAERRGLPSKVVVLGEVEDISYRAPGRSRRAGNWRHKFGDRGDFSPPANGRPLVVADPRSERIAIVQGNSPAKFEPMRGIVG